MIPTYKNDANACINVYGMMSGKNSLGCCKLVSQLAANAPERRYWQFDSVPLVTKPATMSLGFEDE